MKINFAIKRINKILPIMLIVVVMVGTLAFFSDRVEGNASASTTTTTGIDVTTDPDTPYEDDLTGKWANVNSSEFAIFNPGDTANLSYVIANEGQLAVDVRETFIVRSDIDMSANPEFRLYSAASDDAYGAFSSGTVLTQESKIDAKTYKYTIAPYTLSSASEAIDSEPMQESLTYYLVFSPNAGNAFQGVGVTIDHLIEVKQHSTGGEADWTTAASETITFGGQANTNVVPAA